MQDEDEDAGPEKLPGAVQTTFDELKEEMGKLRIMMKNAGMFEGEDGRMLHLVLIDSYKMVLELHDQETKGLRVLTGHATVADILNFLVKQMRDDRFQGPEARSEESKRRFHLVHEVAGRLRESIRTLPGNQDLMDEWRTFSNGLQSLWGMMSNAPKAKNLGPEQYSKAVEAPLRRMLMLIGSLPMKEDEPLPVQITAALRQVYYSIGDITDGHHVSEGVRGPFTEAAEGLTRLKEQREAQGFNPSSMEVTREISEAMQNLWNHMTDGPVSDGEDPHAVAGQVLEIAARAWKVMKAQDDKKKREQGGAKDQALEGIQQQLQRLLEQMRRQDQSQGQTNGNGYQEDGKEENGQRSNGNGQEDEGPMDEIRKLLDDIEKSKGNGEEKPKQDSRDDREERPGSNNNNQAREIDDLIRQIRRVLSSYQSGGNGDDQPQTRESDGQSDRDRLVDDAIAKLNRLRGTIRQLMADHVFGTTPENYKSKREEARRALVEITGMIQRDNLQLPGTAMTELDNARSDLDNLERLARGDPCDREFWRRWMPKDEDDKWTPASDAFFGPEPKATKRK